jgi:hypothetical protein
MIRILLLAAACVTLCACEKTIHEARTPVQQPTAIALR